MHPAHFSHVFRRLTGLAARLALPVLLLLTAASAAALDLGGVHFPDRIMLGTTPLVLNGVGFRRVTILKIKVYVGGLYVVKRTRNAGEILRPESPKSYTIVMKREVTHDESAEAFRKGIERSAGTEAPKLRSEIDAFGRWIPTMREGQTLTAAFNPDSGLLVTSTAKKEAFRGSIPFGTALFGVWIGPRTSDEDLRDALLSGAPTSGS